MGTKKSKKDAASQAEPQKLRAGMTWTDPVTGKAYRMEEGNCSGCAFEHGPSGGCPQANCAPHATADNKTLRFVAIGGGAHEEGPEDLAEHERAACAAYMVPVSLIDPSPYQTRRAFDDEALEQLADNIRAHGLLHPVVVRRRPGFPGRFELIAGERRWRAVRIIGAKERIAASVVEVDDATAAEMCVAENMQRTNLTPLEEAAGVKALLDTGHDVGDVAGRLGRTRQWVRRRAKLCDLSPKVLKLVADPEHNLSRASVEALEYIATMPAELQGDMSDGFRWQMFTAQQLRQRYEHMLRKLDGAAFDTRGCVACTSRTGADADLFGEVDGLGRCLDRQCWDAKDGEAVRAKIDGIRAKHKDALVVSTAHGLYSRGFCDDKWKYEEAQKGAQGAVKAVVIDHEGKTSTCWLKERRKQAQGRQAAPEKSPAEAYADAVAARIIKTVGDWCENWIGVIERDREKASTPFHDMWELGRHEEVLCAVAVFLNERNMEIDFISEGCPPDRALREMFYDTCCWVRDDILDDRSDEAVATAKAWAKAVFCKSPEELESEAKASLASEGIVPPEPAAQAGKGGNRKGKK